MATTLYKARLGVEDMELDLLGTGRTFSAPTSVGGQAIKRAVNADHIPLTVQARGRARWDGSISEQITVDGALSELYGDLRTVASATGGRVLYPSSDEQGITSQTSVVQDNSLAACIASFGTGQGTIVLLPGTYTIDADYTLPNTVSVQVYYGANMSVAAGINLLLSGKLYAGKWSVFTGPGAVRVAWVAYSQPLSPYWFGAAGDGVADDTAAVQSAIDAFTFGGVIDCGDDYGGSGDYFHVTGLNMAPGIVVRGGAFFLLDTKTQSLFMLGSGSSARFSRVYFSCALVTSGDVSAIEIAGPPRDVLISECRVKDAAFSGTPGSGNRHASVYIHGSGVRRIAVTDCYFEKLNITEYKLGVVVEASASAVAVSNNTFVGLATAAVYLDAAIGCVVTGNTINAGPVAYLKDSTHNVISSNAATAVPASVTAIDLVTSDHNVVAENALEGGANAKGVSLSGTGNTVTGNAVDGFSGTGVGIELTGTAGDSAVVANAFGTNATNLVINGASTGHRVSGNPGVADTEAVTTFAVDAATPSVAGGNVFKTANTGVTITALTGGFTGQRVTVIFGDSVTVVDFTGTNLKGNAGVDWSPVTNDSMTCTFDGANWYCDISDNT